MKAAIYTKYGPPSQVLEIKEVEKPVPNNNQVLIKNYSSSINDGDNSIIKGSPFIARFSSGLLKPNHIIPGGDIAGQVEAIGSKVTLYQPGDDVYGDIGALGFGAFAEYVAVQEDAVTPKPSITTFEEAAAVPQYGVVALQALRDFGQVQKSHKVLINGASGAMGTFAVQIAKSYETEVTGVCSTKNLDLVRSIGADYVIDYTQEDFTKGETKYDLILDCVANRSLSDFTSALNPNGSYVSIAFNLSALVLGALISNTGKKKVSQARHTPNTVDLTYMTKLIEEGQVSPVIAKSYPLNEIAEAFRSYNEAHPSGKIVITMEHL